MSRFATKTRSLFSGWGTLLQSMAYDRGYVGILLQNVQFLALASLIFLTPLTYWPMTQWLCFPFYDVIFSIVVCPLFIGSLFFPRLRVPKLGLSDALIGLGIFWIGLNSLTKGSWPAAVPFLHMLVLLFVMTHSNLSSTQLRGLLYAVLAASVIVASFGVAQYLFRQKLPVFAMLLQENTFSGYLSLALPLSFCLWEDRFPRWIGPAVTTLLAFAITLSLTRAGYMAAIIGMAAFAMARDRRLLWLILVYIVGFGLIVKEARTRFVDIAVLPRIAHCIYGNIDRSGDNASPSLPGDSMSARLFLWQFAWREFVSAPVTGIGIGNFRGNLEKYRSANPHELSHLPQVLEPHNSFLKLLCETGLPGALLYLAILGRFLCPYATRLLTTKHAGLDPTTLALFCGLVAFLVHNITNTLLMLVPCSLGFWAGLAALSGILSAEREATEARVTRKLS